MQTQMINFSIPKKLLKTVDDLAEIEMKTRSEFLREAVRNYLEKKLILQKRWETIFSYGKRKAGSVGIKPGSVEKLIDDYREGK